jgi:soluble lytic murein transglycosylase-like protein
MAKRGNDLLWWGIGLTGFLALVSYKHTTPPSKPAPGQPHPKTVEVQTESSGRVLIQTAKNVAWEAPKLDSEVTTTFQAMVHQWDDFVSEASADYAIPKAWLFATMWAESRGNSGAKSSKGAIGLMQVMPYHFKPGEEAYDPRTNIRAGARYMQEKRAKVKNLVEMASAYNAGGPWTNASWIAHGYNPSLTTRWGVPAQPGYIDTVIAANNTYLSLFGASS